MNILLAAIRIGCLAAAGLLAWSMAHIDPVRQSQHLSTDPQPLSGSLDG